MVLMSSRRFHQCELSVNTGIGPWPCHPLQVVQATWFARNQTSRMSTNSCDFADDRDRSTSPATLSRRVLSPESVDSGEPARVNIVLIEVRTAHSAIALVPEEPSDFISVRDDQSMRKTVCLISCEIVEQSGLGRCCECMGAMP